MHSVDPQAEIVGTIPEGLIEIRGSAARAAYIAAIEQAGFQAMPSHRGPRRVRPRGLGRLVGRSIGWGLAWAVLLPLLGFGVMLLVITYNPSCQAPGDSGGCYTGLFTGAPLLALPGAILGLFVTLMRGLRRIRHEQGITTWF